MKNRSKLKVVGLRISVLILVFSIVSMGVVIFTYNKQFPRYDRHDMTITAGLRYSDMESQYPRKLVSFNSGSNSLQGYFYPTNHKKGLVVVVHGIGGGADSYLSQISYFLDQGWDVFTYDATGSFDSEGKSTKGFPQSILDLDSALKFITSKEEFSSLPILLFGHSWGGYAVANILHYDYEIKGVATVSGANSAMEMILEQGEKIMGKSIYLQYPFLWLYQTMSFGKSSSLNAVEAINKSDTPVLIIHGKEDEFVDYKGSSIISKLSTITNANIKTITLSETGRNGHNNIFRSDAAMNYIEDVNIEYRKLYDSHDKNIPYKIKQEFYSKIDRNLAQEVNIELMNDIHNFFVECVNR